MDAIAEQLSICSPHRVDLISPMGPIYQSNERCDFLLQVIQCTELNDPSPQQRVMRKEVASLMDIDGKISIDDEVPANGAGGAPAAADLVATGVKAWVDPDEAAAMPKTCDSLEA